LKKCNSKDFKRFHYREEKSKPENRIYGKPVFYPPNGTGRDYYILLTNGGLTRNVRDMRKTNTTKYIESLRTEPSHPEVILEFSILIS
jgi:hypothetical protein